MLPSSCSMSTFVTPALPPLPSLAFTRRACSLTFSCCCSRLKCHSADFWSFSANSEAILPRYVSLNSCAHGLKSPYLAYDILSESSASFIVSNVFGPSYLYFSASLQTLRILGRPLLPVILIRLMISFLTSISPRIFCALSENGTLPLLTFLHRLSAYFTDRRTCSSICSYKFWCSSSRS